MAQEKKSEVGYEPKRLEQKEKGKRKGRRQRTMRMQLSFVANSPLMEDALGETRAGTSITPQQACQEGASTVGNERMTNISPTKEEGKFLQKLVSCTVEMFVTAHETECASPGGPKKGARTAQVNKPETEQPAENQGEGSQGPTLGASAAAFLVSRGYTFSHEQFDDALQTAFYSEIGLQHIREFRDA